MLSAGIAFADESTLERSLLACSDQQDDAERLSCFDRATATITITRPPTERFGKEHFSDPNANPSITALVTNVTMDNRDKLKITLDNGQTWVQSGSERYRVSPGERIVIERGSMNSFFLRKAASTRKIRFYRAD
ncbi:MAG: hypothetical protein HC809_01560 [Gammaproteobacteria bacterium]|nr:hypothetical protein [Gammaproteobacteria bacterium]